MLRPFVIVREVLPSEFARMLRRLSRSNLGGTVVRGYRVQAGRTNRSR